METPTKAEISDALSAMNMLGENEYMIYGVKAEILRRVSRHLINQQKENYHVSKKQAEEESSQESR